MQHLAIAKLNRCAGFTFDFESDNAGEILAEVENVNVVCR